MNEQQIDKVWFEVDWITLIFEELKNKHCRQDAVAQTYAYIMQKYGPEAPYREINNAIIERWSMSGLQRVKTMAWRDWMPNIQHIQSPSAENSNA